MTKSKKSISEAFKSNILRGVNNGIGRTSPYRKGGDLSRKLDMDITTKGTYGGSNSLDSSFFLDKITDDMISAKGNMAELRKSGYTISSLNDREAIVDTNGQPHFALKIPHANQEGGPVYIVFNNDKDTEAKVKQLSVDAGKVYSEREKNRRYTKNNSYTWNNPEGGRAFRDWKHTAPLWDDPEFRRQRDVNVPENWRDTNNWLKAQSDKAIDKYRKNKEERKKEKDMKLTEEKIKDIVKNSIKKVLKESINNYNEENIGKEFIAFIEKYHGGVLLQDIVDYESGNEFGSPVSPLPMLISEFEESVLNGQKCTPEMRKAIRSAYNQWWNYAQSELLPDNVELKESKNCKLSKTALRKIIMESVYKALIEAEK